MKTLAQWLHERGDGLYGNTRDDWKPFDGKTMGELLGKGGVYHSETHLIDALDEELSNRAILVRSGIEVFFVDVFALFSDWYKRLASMLDLMIADTDKKCCLIVPYGLSDDANFVLTAYAATWGGVVEAYLQGALHPIILRADDLTHLRNHLLRLPRPGKEPQEQKIQQMDAAFGNKPKPQFGFGRR
jgi:hypothetical protein